MKFTYRWGQKPLDGYTIKRGLGQGGFGEVYFALSDGGKEVALKLIRGRSDTELRGIANCLNLKHPHLVHLYDLRADAQGDRWLVMEYIHGEPLSAVLQRNPRGLPESQAREWFLQTAHAVAYLHDHAVVHRDIKPGNLFVEGGAVKLGDYGLSKSVAASQHAQSSNVGTIHYMAPEVASGNYSKQIDIYACGVMLYEMLTGEVPFKGESWAEIAMKHQTDLPNLDKVPAPYVPILERALHKQAERRFRGMPEMIEAVEAMDRPKLEDRRPVMPIVATEANVKRKPDVVKSNDNAHTSWRTKLGELSKALLFAPVAALPITAIWALFTGSVNWGVLGTLFLLMTATAWSVLLVGKAWEGREESRPRRLTLALSGALIGCLGFWLAGWSFPEYWMQDDPLPPGQASYWGGVLRAEEGSLETLGGFMAFFALALFLPRWWLSADRHRADRFSLYPLIANGILALILLGLWKNNRFHGDDPPGYLALAIAGAAAIVQLVSPYEPRPKFTTRYRRRLNEANGRVA